MNLEPEIKELNGDESQPASRGDVNDLARLVSSTMASKEDLKQLATKGEFQSLKSELTELVTKQAEETRRHFDVVAENIHKDVADANKDEISLIKDQQLPDHEERIQELEKEAGIPVGPKHAPVS